jgi:hypothetical protein
VAKRKQAWEARDVEQRFDVGVPIELGEQEPAHVVEREPLQFLEIDRWNEKSSSGANRFEAATLEGNATLGGQSGRFRVERR